MVARSRRSVPDEWQDINVWYQVSQRKKKNMTISPMIIGSSETNARRFLQSNMDMQ